jgi:hypothetical protein
VFPRAGLSESELLYDWRFTANQIVLATSPLRLTTSNFVFQLNTCCYSPYVTSSLARGWVFRLQLLLALASAVILTITFDCLTFETPPIWRARSLYLYPSGTGWPGFTPMHCSLFVASYDSQGYGEGIRPHLHTGRTVEETVISSPRRKIELRLPGRTAVACRYSDRDKYGNCHIASLIFQRAFN